MENGNICRKLHDAAGVGWGTGAPWWHPSPKLGRAFGLLQARSQMNYTTAWLRWEDKIAAKPLMSLWGTAGQRNPSCHLSVPCAEAIRVLWGPSTATGTARSHPETNGAVERREGTAQQKDGRNVKASFNINININPSEGLRERERGPCPASEAWWGLQGIARSPGSGQG